MSYVDLHIHLLPGVDDGAADEHAALEHARRLACEGVRDVTATPHINGFFPLEIASIPQRVEQLAAALAEDGIGVRVHTGGELDARHARSLGDADLETIAQGPPGSRWLLVEAPFRGIDEEFAADCDALAARGFGIVLAHPERARGAETARGHAALRALLEAGALAQVNVCSLLGNNGLTVQETAVSLLRNGLAYVIASDGHPGTRDHTLALGFVLAQRAGASSVQAWRLTQANPRFLLVNGIPPAPSAATTAALELALD
ncbi:MAG TPA: CpsB/CapC family capsule biosynthesis tyrosine phosphatase [Solirubrobacteraceae bacterium]|jgi:protein-tyrosine phosphatase